jgi:plastocyanin
VNGSVFQVLAVFSGTAFYVLGICLASLALIVTALGLRSSQAFSSTMASRGLIALFAVIVAGVTTFAVRYSGHEQHSRQAKLAEEEAKFGATPVPGGGKVPSPDAAALGGIPATGQTAQSQPAAPQKQPKVKGPGGTVKLAASPTQIAYSSKSLSSKPGKVTIDFNNPAPIQHDVAVAKGNQIVAKSALISNSSTSVSIDLPKGSYTFFCTVPGHRQAGMQGTLTIK